MNSGKLNESESKPNMALKKIGHELDIAETKCFTLKSELNYMMGVCRKAETKGSKGTSETSQEQISFKPSDIIRPSPRSIRFSPRKAADDDVIERTADSKEDKQKELLNVTPKAQSDKKFAITTAMMPNQAVEANREYENLLSCYPGHVEEQLQSMLSAEESIEESISKADEDYFCMIPSSKRDLVDSELNLEISDVAKARRAEKRKRATRQGDKRETNSFYKGDDATISKVRKRKGKLRSSISKSTVATKNTNCIGKKEAKRRKHRGPSIINQQSNFSKYPRRSSDVVEIFHNTTLKSSNSGVSNGQYSKLSGQMRKHLTEVANEKIQEISLPKRVNHEFHNKEDQPNNLQTLNYPNDFKQTPVRSFLGVQQQNKSEKHSNDLSLSTQGKAHQCEHVFNKCNDPTPNYEMPTLASKLKRSNRSCLNRYSFQNIPFVVGTSVTPSHNLGLNIQQVLSVMKTRQPITSNIAPLLIRKQRINRGIKPVSMLLEQMNGNDERSLLNISSQITGLFNNGENSGDKAEFDHDKKLSLDLHHVGKTPNIRISNADDMKSREDNDIFKRFHEEKNNFHENHNKQQSLSVINKKNISASMRSQQKISRLSLNKEDLNIGDYKVPIPGSQNSKEIRDILINLHDQFEEMNMKYEKLQSEIEKSNDESLTKELSTLEKELNVKEEEISAVIGLYKEVMVLKQQMKMLHEKNSFIYIESPKEFHKSHFPISIIRKPHSMNATHIFERRQAYNTTRKPPTSIQLTALLRQIQAFHKQLQLVS